MGWRRSKFSNKIGEDIVTLTVRKMDLNSLLCKLALWRLVR
jgi:hypothetical protein